MRFLIVAAAVLACAAAAPSGALLAGPYSHGLVGHGALGLGGIAVGHGAPLAIGHAAAIPTIPPGDLQGAAIDAHVEAIDHARASVDATREWHDQASEVQGQAVNAAEDHAWQSVDASLTAQAQVDGAAAGVAPVVARQLAGHGALGYAAHAPVVAGHAGLIAGHAGLAGLAGVGHAGLGYAGLGHAGLGHAGLGHAGLGHAGLGLAGSHSVATSSLSQTHPAPIVHAPVAYAGHGALLGHAGLGHGIAHGW